MLPLKNRLKKKTDFGSVYKKGRGAFFEGVSIRFAKNSLKETRIGFSVGIKFSKKAVVRNRAKRQLREIFREEIKNLKPGFDIIVSLHPQDNFKNLKERIEKALKKASLTN